MTEKERDTVTYELKDGNTIVYIGTTNDSERREEEHGDKEFSHMNITSRRMTEEGAKKQEAEKLETYRKNHGGKNPKYNKKSGG